MSYRLKVSLRFLRLWLLTPAKLSIRVVSLLAGQQWWNLCRVPMFGTCSVIILVVMLGARRWCRHTNLWASCLVMCWVRLLGLRCRVVVSLGRCLGRCVSLRGRV